LRSALLRELLGAAALARGASAVALSGLAVERIVAHPYAKLAVAKAALERVTLELVWELGRFGRLADQEARDSQAAEAAHDDEIVLLAIDESRQYVSGFSLH